MYQRHIFKSKREIFLYYYFFFCLFSISWAAPVAYGGPQARGVIKATTASLGHSNSNEGSTSVTYITALQGRTLKPVSEVRDQTCKLMVPSQIR